MDNKKLIELAKKAMENSYAPYSKFKVGAAVLGQSGNVYTGCNIENASFGATNCAERTAVFKAVSEGERKLVKIAIVSSAEDLTFPCGICRQVLAEFMKNGTYILEDKNGNVREFGTDELLPNSFNLQ
ncbi:MAG: cytidine deaminase [Firmicutes bacterium]|nr:cytidine deaminase [Bacillota bacterium]